MKSRMLLLFSTILFVCTLSPQPLFAADKAQGDPEEVFRKYEVEGCFVLCPIGSDDCFRLNAERCGQRFIPASTFKIVNSMIALETGAVESTEEILPWDGTEHWIKSWNQDQDMEHAFQRSCVWFYQELARRIGQERMDQYLAKSNYGNMSTAGGIDRFWLDGGLLISAEEQIAMLRRLDAETLPFAADVQRTVKRLMVLERGDNYILSGKTGLGKNGEAWVGWLVGFIESGGTKYCYALNIESPDITLKQIASLRHTVLRDILTARGLM
ncbi:class D beta-lactamase [bacterium]|nr:class D beta-lactamase [bacterium]